MKKLICTAIILAAIVLDSPAQRNRDILYLKNGAKVFGTLQEVSDNNYKIRVNDSTLFTFPLSEVEKYTHERDIYKGRRDHGLGFSLEAGLLIGSQSTTYDHPFSFNAILHYTVSTSNVFGFGTGVEYLGKAYTPIFLEYRCLFRAKGVTPYLFARAGGLAYFGPNDNSDNTYNPNYYQHRNYTGGSSFTIGAGVSWPGDGIETNLSFAYRYARTGYVQTESNLGDVTYTTKYNRLELKLGFRF